MINKTTMNGVIITIVLVLVKFSISSRLNYDKDGLHPKPSTRPSTDDPKAGYSDWINPPDKAAKIDWYEEAQKQIEIAMEQAQKLKDLHKPAKNVIIFIGDGFGITTATAARIFRAQQNNLTGDDASLSWDRMPYSGFSKTYTVDDQTADSASGATAIFCGQKTRSGAVGVTQNVFYYNCTSSIGNEAKSIIHYGSEQGKWGGVVSTARVTHATPAAAYAHSASREWEAKLLRISNRRKCKDIGAQLVDNALNQDIHVVLGGGRSQLTPDDAEDPVDSGSFGSRKDGRNLIEEWQQKRRDLPGVSDEEVKYVYNMSAFQNIDPAKVKYLMGLFSTSHMSYEADRVQGEITEPGLSEMVEKAIKILQAAPDGYILAVESARIDTAHHNNQAHKAMIETVEFQNAVQMALDLTSEEDSLVVVTGDHSHVFTIAGYSKSDVNIVTFDETNNIGNDDKPYTTLGYNNGPGYEDHRLDNNGTFQPRMNLTGMQDELLNYNFVYDSGIKKSSDSHSGEDVPVYARGPMAHLLQGTMEQSDIGNIMMYAACVGENKDLCQPDFEKLCP